MCCVKIDINKIDKILTIDWCLTPTLTVFQLYCDVNKC